MNFMAKELEENQLKLEIHIDPNTNLVTMKTHIDDKSETFDAVSADSVMEDPLLQLETKDPVELVKVEDVAEDSLNSEQIEFEKMSELDQLIYLERQRLLNLKLPKITNTNRKGNKYFWDTNETDSNRQLTQNEKSMLRMRKLRETESAEEREYRKFRCRVRTLKTRLLQKLQNFGDEAYLKEMNKRACDRTKKMRLKIKESETPAQEALRKKRVNMARRRLFLKNKVFRTPEDLLREKEKRTKYLERIRARLNDEQYIAKRRQDAKIAREKRRQNNKEWDAIQRAIKGQVMQDV